jgi:hypothetical protein
VLLEPGDADEARVLRVADAVEGADGAAHDEVGRDAPLGQRPQHADLDRAEVATTAEDESDRSGTSAHPIEEPRHRVAAYEMGDRYLLPRGTGGGAVLSIAAIAAGEIGGGNVSDNLNDDTVRNGLLVLMFVCGVALIIVLRTVAKQSTRFLLVGLLAGLGVLLYLQRERLDDCADQCTCRILGQDVDIDGAGALCPDN